MMRLVLIYLRILAIRKGPLSMYDAVLSALLKCVSRVVFC
jgi:hypothetical protein